MKLQGNWEKKSELRTKYAALLGNDSKKHENERLEHTSVFTPSREETQLKTRCNICKWSGRRTYLFEEVSIRQVLRTLAPEYVTVEGPKEIFVIVFEIAKRDLMTMEVNAMFRNFESRLSKLIKTIVYYDEENLMLGHSVILNLRPRQSSNI